VVKTLLAIENLTNISIRSEELIKCVTIEELYDFVTSKSIVQNSG